MRAREAQDAAPDGKDMAMQLLQRVGGKRSQQLVTAIALGQLAWPVAQKAKSRWFTGRDYTISVAGVDDVYPLLHQWVLERIPGDERMALIADTVREKPHVRLAYDGSRTQLVQVDGHGVWVEVFKEEMPGGNAQLPDNWRRVMETIKFTAGSAEGRDAVARMIEGLAEERFDHKGPPPLYMPSRWGGDWNQRGDLPPRTLESVVLKDGQLERLVADLERFIKAEGVYGELAQSWHRGYLFHGIPGTGKTSVARALADHLEMPVYYLPLGDMESDVNLMQLVGQIRPRSVLLIEDIDIYSRTIERSDEKDSSSLAGMLNALDGVWTPHGLITVMTTNDRDSLDEALVRKGRIDVEEAFTALDEDQARRLAAFCDVRYKKRFVGQSPADMMEHAKRKRMA